MAEEKGFVIKDRRPFDDKGELRREDAPPEKKPETPKGPETKAKGTSHGEEASTPLPPVTFSSLIFSLSSSALYHLGELADPQTGQTNKDLPMAKNAIDTIALLKEKTQGNLSDEEEKFLDSVLSDLRWRYVKSVG